MKKLKLNKETIVSLSTNEQLQLKGGWTTSYGDCSQVINTYAVLCCNETESKINTGSWGCNEREQPNDMQ